MISTTDDAAAPLTDAGEFLAEYTAWLWGCGATCIRIEKNVGRIAAAWGLHCDLTVMPRQVSVVLSRPGAQGAGQMFTAKIKPCGINFDINSNLSRLSWNIADRAIKVERAGDLLEGVVTRHYRVTPAELLLVGLANASFCRLFGGDAAAMLTVLVATLAGYFIKGMMLRNGADVRVTFFISLWRHTLRMGCDPRCGSCHKCALPYSRRALHQRGERPHRPALPLRVQPVCRRMCAHGLSLGRVVSRHKIAWN